MATGARGPTGPHGEARTNVGGAGSSKPSGGTGARGPTGPQGQARSGPASGGYGGKGSTGARGPTGPQGQARSSPGGGYGGGRPGGGYQGGGPTGGPPSRTGPGMGFSGKMGAQSGQHIAGVSRPGSYAGPKGARALENQALVAAHGPYGHYTNPIQQAQQRLQARGWSPTAAAGIVGRLNVESPNLNPMAAGDFGPEYGMPKGVPSSAGIGQHRLNRRTDLERETQPFSGYNKKTKQFTTGPTVNQQLDFMDRQLKGLGTKNLAGKMVKADFGAKKAGRNLMANPNMSVKSAAREFTKNYERPADSELGKFSRVAVLGGAAPRPNVQIAARPSINIEQAGYTTQMPRAKPDIRGMTVGMPRAKPSIGIAPSPAYAQMSPAMTSAFAAPRRAIPTTINRVASPATAYSMPRAKPISPATRAVTGMALSPIQRQAMPMTLNGGLAQLGATSKRSKRGGIFGQRNVRTAIRTLGD